MPYMVLRSGLWVGPEHLKRRRHMTALRILLLVSLSMLSVVRSAWTRELLFAPIDGPGASSTEVNGIANTGQIVGNFRNRLGTHGFMCSIPCSSEALRPLDLWFNGYQAVSTHIQGVSDSGHMAGFFLDVNGENHGFVCKGLTGNLDCWQVDVTVNEVAMAGTLILSIHEQARFVGSYREGQSKIHGFLFQGERFERVDVPQSVATVVSAIGVRSTTNQATIAGFFVDAKFEIHGFVCRLPISPDCFMVFDVTLSGVPQTMTQPTAINQDTLVGSFRDRAGNAHGFVCDLPVHPGCFVQVDAYGGKNTEVLGINYLRQIVGRYDDVSGRQRAFITQTR